MKKEILYRIIRFRQNKPSQRVRGLNYLTRAEAQRICSDPRTSGRTWFYGFQAMEGSEV